jgi:hypothetical protein
MSYFYAMRYFPIAQVVSNGITIVNKLERMWKETVTVHFKILSPGKPPHVILSRLYMVSEPRTSQSKDSKTLKFHTSWNA